MRGVFEIVGYPCPQRSCARPVSSAMRLLAMASAVAAGLSCGPRPARAEETPARNRIGPGEDTQGAQASVNEVVVTASRIERSGFSAPTPTTVLGQDELRLSGSANIADTLNEVPAFKGAVTPTSTTTAAGSAGQNILSLRGLGASRTLVLVDGRRHVPGNSSGTFNLNVIPSGLIERVEVVTGGASAAWGSDAVAGVVNIIFDHEREGLSGEAQYGMSNYGDGEEYKAGLTYGTSIAGGRGHFTVSGEVADNRGIARQDDRPWGREGWQVIANPAWQPGNGEYARLTVRNAHIANATEGGLILGPEPFQNIEFGPGGVPGPFVRGQHAGTGFMQGGDGVNLGAAVTLQVPVERQVLYTRASFDLSDAMTMFAEASYGRTASEFDILPTFDFGTLVISRDNAFLPESIREDMEDRDIGQLQMGRLNTDFGYVRSANENVTRRAVAGLNGTLGAGWHWDAYVQHGKTRIDGFLKNSRLEARYREALDSVIDPSTGDAVCRSTLSDPGNGCVALDIFGKGSPDPAALAYINADQHQISDISQSVAAINVGGEPFSTWAGPVSTAFGAEYRREAVDQWIDELSAAGAFTLGNPTPIDGSFHVREAYGEAVVPLFAGNGLKALDLNLAARATDYSISGFETTWKAGLTWQINDAVRLRATRSRDIRAPNLGELFAQTSTRFRTVTDPTTGQQTTIRMLSGGNPQLEAERADTITAGIVFEPARLAGLRTSLDVYDINIEGAVGTLEAQDIVTRCANGATQLCPLIHYGAANTIESVQANLLNLNTLKTRGVDFEASYGTALADLVADLPGDIRLRLLGTYVDTLITDDGINAIDRAGDVGPFIDGIPHWRWNASLAYSYGPTTLQVQGRYVGGGAYDHTLGALGIDDNSVGSRFYVDLSLQRDLYDADGRSAQLFLSMNNLLDTAPSIAPDTAFIPLATNKQIYDVIGRYFAAGVRFNY